MASLKQTLNEIMSKGSESSPQARSLEVEHWLRLTSLSVSAGVIRAVSQVAPLAGLEDLEQQMQV